MKKFIISILMILSLVILSTGCSSNQTHEEMINEATDNLAKAKDTLAKVEKSAVKISGDVATNAPKAAELAGKVGGDAALIEKINAAGVDAAKVADALQKTKAALANVPANTEVVDDSQPPKN